MDGLKGRGRAARKGSALCIRTMAERIECAVSLARSARALIETGDEQRAFGIALDIEPLLREANNALQAAAVLPRMQRLD